MLVRCFFFCIFVRIFVKAQSFTSKVRYFKQDAPNLNLVISFDMRHTVPIIVRQVL